jgi:dihydroxyacetone kinase
MPAQGKQRDNLGRRTPIPYLCISDKHFMNQPSDLVRESLEGLCLLNSQLSLDPINNGALKFWRIGLHYMFTQWSTTVIHVNPANASKVALISGGGSGHEPAHAGELKCFFSS